MFLQADDAVGEFSPYFDADGVDSTVPRCSYNQQRDKDGAGDDRKNHAEAELSCDGKYEDAEEEDTEEDESNENTDEETSMEGEEDVCGS